MCQMVHRHSICCILPPHILRAVAQNGSPKQRTAALKTLAIDNTLRALRAAPRAPGVQRRLRTLTEEGVKQRTLYTANNTETLPGTLVLSEGDTVPAEDLPVKEAYEGLGGTYDFFWKAYERHSIDDEGRPLIATVHYGQDYNNAFWNGEQMVFGDGDGELFNRFTISLDIIGHELAHGVTEDEAGLVYFFQAGALNEHLSDVFGSLVKQSALMQTADQADWLIGEGLFTANVQGVALRSMKAPGTAYDDPILGKDPQPAYMKDFVHTWEDNGGVHINSGIPNHAFYLVATRLGGSAWERSGRIWYATLRDERLRPNTGFKRFARLTATVAGRLYGEGSEEQQAVLDGWREVGVIDSLK
jgi:Zn-dependent metalloprotease